MSPELFLAKKQLLQISNRCFMPKEWLDGLVPENLKFFPSPYNDYPFLLLEDLMGRELCRSFCQDIINESECEFIGLLAKDEGILGEKIDTRIRKTLSYIPTNLLEIAYSDMFLGVKSTIEDYFKLAIVQSSALQVLGYERGYFYERHSDNCSEIFNKHGDIVEFSLTAPHRKLTTVFFISEYAEEPQDIGEFSGGELVFDFICDEKGVPFTLQPKRGVMVAFPSNPYFSHTVKEVLCGYRISLVQWHDCVVL